MKAGVWQRFIVSNALAFFGFCLSIPTVEAQPIGLTNQHPLAQQHLSFRTLGAKTERKGQFRLELLGAWSNTVNRERGAYLVDAETRQLNGRVEYSPTDDLVLGLSQALDYRGAGVTDSWIDDWHQAFGLPRGPRSKLPEDEYAIHTDTRDGREFDLPQSGTHFSDLDLESRFQFYQSGDKSLSFVAASMLRLPTGAATYGQDSVDFGAALVVNKVFGQWTLGGQIGYLRYLDQSLHELRYEKDHYSSGFGLEYRLVSGVSLLASVLLESAMLDNIPRYPDYQVYFDLGLRIPLDQSYSVVVGFRENMPEDSTTDFSLFLGLSYAVATLS